MTSNSLDFITTLSINIISKLPKYALVHFPDAIKIQLPGLKPGVIPVEPVTASFQISQTGCDGNPGKITIKRYQLPLIWGWVITDYKSQGATFQKVVDDFAKPPGRSQPAQAYVALSRVKSLAGLSILREFEIDTLAEPTAYMNAETARLNGLSQNS